MIKTKTTGTMKNYQIVLYDTVTKELEKVEYFIETEYKNLSQRLLELQQGYCQDEKPTVTVKTIASNGRRLSVAIAESDCDFSYMAVLKRL